MDEKKIIINYRVDGGKILGIGHLMRALNIYKDFNIHLKKINFFFI